MIGVLVIPLTMTVITSFGQRDPDGNVIYSFTLENYWRLLGFGEAGGWNDIYLTILLALALAGLADHRHRDPDGLSAGLFHRPRRAQPAHLLSLPGAGAAVDQFRHPHLCLGDDPAHTGRTQWHRWVGSLVCFNVPFAPFDFYPSQGAVLIGMVYEFLPFMILPIYTSLEKIDPALYEAAADLGANARCEPSSARHAAALACPA
jgi:hypothetical protein